MVIGRRRDITLINLRTAAAAAAGTDDDATVIVITSHLRLRQCCDGHTVMLRRRRCRPRCRLSLAPLPPGHRGFVGGPPNTDGISSHRCPTRPSYHGATYGHDVAPRERLSPKLYDNHQIMFGHIE